MRTAVVIGTVALDLVAASATSSHARAAVGNTGANIAVRLSAAGWNVEFVSLVGRDSAADLVEEDLRRWGVGTSGVVRREGYLTPRVFQALSTSSSSASLLLTCPRCDRPRGHRLEIPRPDELPESVVAFARDADLVIADVAGPAFGRLVSASRGLTWYEASLREATDAEIADLAGRVDAVKCSSEELDHFAAAFADAAEGPRLRIVTEGAQGVRFQERPAFAWSDWTHTDSTLRTPPIDTIGAGDAFTAAAAGVLAEGGTALSAVEAGSDAAALACMSEGARGDMVLSGEVPSAWLDVGVAFQCGRCDAGI